MRRLTSLLALGALAVSTACGTMVPPDPGVQDPFLIAGFDATSATLDAVGSLYTEDEVTGSYVFCSGTLIGPSTVLTARHCEMDPATVTFLIGSDAKAPKQRIQALAFDTAPISTGGAMGLGSDVAVYHLAHAVQGVIPFPVDGRPLAASDIGSKLVSIGFGLQSEKDYPHANTRKAGAGTVQALRGKLFEIMLGNLEAFLAYVTEDLGADYVAANRDALIKYFDSLILLEGYEAVVGNATGDSQTCFGDSGGPLLRQDADHHLVVTGVVSGGIGSKALVCDKGSVYAIFGETTRSFLTDSVHWVDPCGDVSFVGQCDGTVARRCTGSGEGPRRQVAFDCADLNQICTLDGAGNAACVDATTP